MSPDDTLRALLNDAAENAPAYRPVDVDADLPITAARRWTALGLVAAAFVVIAAGGLVLSRTNDNADLLPPISDSTAPVQPTPTVGKPSKAVRCPADAFSVTWTTDGVGAGSMTSWFRVTNTSSKTCRVSAVGPREAQGVAPDGSIHTVAVQASRATSYQLAATRQLAPGESGQFVIGTGNAGACDSPLSGIYTAFRVDLGATEPFEADFQDSLSLGCGVWVTGIGVPPSTPTKPSLKVATVEALYAFLRAWESDGIAKASAEYLEPEYQMPTGTTGPRLARGAILRDKVVSKSLPDMLVLEVHLILHFHGDTGAWSNGLNTRFVTGRRATPTSPVRLAFATGP